MKKIFICLLIFIMLLGSTSCDGKRSNVFNLNNVIASPDSKLVDLEVIEYNFYQAILVDKNTGVMYLWITANCGGITPLYNADGSIKLYSEDE